ncbi:hypothetical protein [Microbacterium sp. zg-YB36]|uniref:hypothetical protein n=1 Tax=Microbacterium sp. zg-YB36 TaxID=2969407 RepID=UPI00214C8D1A|nr:hypothetical protein [Microbacterium sp. zg-YB36]MDL5350562.1 hypothetical protein [Microbacterium sp. zg-YB36]
MDELAKQIAAATDSELERFLPREWLSYPHTVEWALTVFRAAGYTWNGRRMQNALSDTMTVYRGGSKNGVSWTFHIELAEAFREMHANGTRSTMYLYSAEVPKEAVLATLTTRGLSELIVDPGLINPTRVPCEFYSCTEDALEDVRCEEHLKLRPSPRNLNLRMLRAIQRTGGWCVVCGGAGAIYFTHPPQDWRPGTFRSVHLKCVKDDERDDLLHLDLSNTTPADAPIILSPL